jgi:hypothetical protein
VASEQEQNRRWIGDWITLFHHNRRGLYLTNAQRDYLEALRTYANAVEALNRVDIPDFDASQLQGEGPRGEEG